MRHMYHAYCIDVLYHGWVLQWVVFIMYWGVMRCTGAVCSVSDVQCFIKGVGCVVPVDQRLQCATGTVQCAKVLDAFLRSFRGQ